MVKIRWCSATIVGILPVLAAVLFYHLDTFDPAPYPEHELTRNGPPLFIPIENSNMLQGSEKIGHGELLMPEDIAYDPKTGVIYTGCHDGWISRVTLNDSAADSVVEKWINTGGRPLGIAHGLHGEVIVADADKGLLNISKDGAIELLTDEAEGLKFKLTDAVDVGPDGMLYFTDASYKHTLKEAFQDVLEGRPYGRFLSYDPSTKQTRVLLKDLYTANGVAVSPDQSFVIVCETAMRRCIRYYIQGPKKGSVDMFIENLPGFVDNIRYDGEGQYWIALNTRTQSPKAKTLSRHRDLVSLTPHKHTHAAAPHLHRRTGFRFQRLDGSRLGGWMGVRWTLSHPPGLSSEMKKREKGTELLEVMSLLVSDSE